MDVLSASDFRFNLEQSCFDSAVSEKLVEVAKYV
jgi:hypothetical protein